MCVLTNIYIHVFEDLYDILLLELTLGPRTILKAGHGEFPVNYLGWIPLFQQTFAQKPPVVLSNPYTVNEGLVPLNRFKFTRKEHLKKEN